MRQCSENLCQSDIFMIITIVMCRKRHDISLISTDDPITRLETMKEIVTILHDLIIIIC